MKNPVSPNTSAVHAATERSRPGDCRPHRFRASDGWPLELHEYLPEPGMPRAPRPVVCCHGAFCNHRIFDLGGGAGLAPWLASQGFHVFAINLRGRDPSLPRSALARWRCRLARGWTLQDFVQRDLPAIFERVCTLSKQSRLDLVGHSMAGVVALQYLRAQPRSALHGLVLVGSADERSIVLDPEMSPGAGPLGQILTPLTWTLPFIPIDRASRTGAQLRWLLGEGAFHLAVNPANVEPATLDTFLKRCLVGVSTRKLRSFGALAKHLARTPPEQDLPCLAPTLMLAGSDDRLVSHAAMERARGRLNAAPCELVAFGRSHGQLQDYGHADLLIGKHAHTEVFPHIPRWLRTLDPAPR